MFHRQVDRCMKQCLARGGSYQDCLFWCYGYMNQPSWGSTMSYPVTPYPTTYFPMQPFSHYPPDTLREQQFGVRNVESKYYTLGCETKGDCEVCEEHISISSDGKFNDRAIVRDQGVFFGDTVTVTIYVLGGKINGKDNIVAEWYWQKRIEPGDKSRFAGTHGTDPRIANAWGRITGVKREIKCTLD